MTIRIKAVGDWELDVLGVPFGGPNGGKDVHGEFFDANTNLHLDRYPTPAVHYYHGFDPDGKPQGTPVEIGEVKSVERRAEGVWYRIVLDKTKELAKRVMDAARAGLARASSGTVGHLVRTAANGHIENWPVVEVSVFDSIPDAGVRPPANNYAVAIPVMKSLLAKHGIDIPEENEPEDEVIGEQQRTESVSDGRVTQLKARWFLMENEK